MSAATATAIAGLIFPNSSLFPLNPSNPKTIKPPTTTTTRILTFNPKNKSAPRLLCHFLRPDGNGTRRIAAAAAALEGTGQGGPQTLKSRLSSGETLYGMFLCSFCPTLAEIAGLAGYDFVVVDMEHGYGGLSESLSCLRALAATGTPAVLRLPETTAAWAKKALDLGPQGIMFPMIETPAEAQRAVSFCRYPPAGVRGAAHPIVRASGYGVHEGYLASCEDDLLVMCQVESADAVSRIQDIAAVEGVDCVQMGPTDLSATMGYLWDPGNPKVMEALKAAERAVLLAHQGEATGTGTGKAYLSGFAMPHDGPDQLRARGYHMVSGAVDIALFRNAALQDVNKFKHSLGVGEGPFDDDDGADRTADDAKDNDDDDDKYWSE